MKMLSFTAIGCLWLAIGCEPDREVRPPTVEPSVHQPQARDRAAVPRSEEPVGESAPQQGESPPLCDMDTLEFADTDVSEWCALELPESDSFPTLVTVPTEYGPAAVPQLHSLSHCVGSGWVWQFSGNGTRVALCGRTCNQLTAGTIEVHRGCSGEPAMPAVIELPWQPDEDEPAIDNAAAGDDAPGDCGQGVVEGLVCAPGGASWGAGVTVKVTSTDCHGTQKVAMAATDADGHFSLSGVPEGLQSVWFGFGSESYSTPVYVGGGAVTDMTTLAKKQCSKLMAPGACFDNALAFEIDEIAEASMVDIIIAVDTSGSMWEEAAAVQAQLNTFATELASSGGDYRVILIADDSVCIPQPLGGPGCTDGPDFRHVVHYVNSFDSLWSITATYSQYSDFLRDGAETHFVVVSDDDSMWTAAWFDAQVFSKALFSHPYVFHSVVGLPTDGYFECPGIASYGSTYLHLSQNTGGQTHSICSSDWSDVYQGLAQAVVSQTCSFPLSEVTSLQNAETVTMWADAGDGGVELPLTGGLGGCGAGGFYAVADPPSIRLCPESCEALGGAQLQLDWTCPAP